MKISILVASASNGTIGIANRLPWHLSEDLKQFRLLTTGHTILMGRKTFESIGKALPKRRNLVLTRQEQARKGAHEGVEFFENITTAIENAKMQGENELFIIGGAAIYELALPFAERLYWTRVQADVAGDAFFTLPNIEAWKMIQSTAFAADEKNEYPFELQIWDRIQA